MTDTDEGLRGLAEFIADRAAPKSMPLLIGEKASGHRDLMAVPNGFRLESVKKYLDEYLLAPERIKGTSRHSTTESLLNHFETFKLSGTAIFANGDARDPKVTVVYDYSGSSIDPKYGDHRAVLDCTLSDEWKTWSARANVSMAQHEFAAFIEDNIGDIQPKSDLTDDANAILKEVSLMPAYRFAGQDTTFTLNLRYRYQ